MICLQLWTIWSLLLVLLLNCCMPSTAQIMDDDLVLLRRFRRVPYYSEPVFGSVGPRRMNRLSFYSADYTPTPCRWKLCASILN